MIRSISSSTCCRGKVTKGSPRLPGEVEGEVAADRSHTHHHCQRLRAIQPCSDLKKMLHHKKRSYLFLKIYAFFVISITLCVYTSVDLIMSILDYEYDVCTHHNSQCIIQSFKF